MNINKAECSRTESGKQGDYLLRGQRTERDERTKKGLCGRRASQKRKQPEQWLGVAEDMVTRQDGWAMGERGRKRRE